METCTIREWEKIEISRKEIAELLSIGKIDERMVRACDTSLTIDPDGRMSDLSHLHVRRRRINMISRFTVQV
jgi:hypothetical protein